MSPGDCESALPLCRPGGWAPGAGPGCVGWLVSEEGALSDSDLIPETETQNCRGAALVAGAEGRQASGWLLANRWCLREQPFKTEDTLRVGLRPAGSGCPSAAAIASKAESTWPAATRKLTSVVFYSAPVVSFFKWLL